MCSMACSSESTTRTARIRSPYSARQSSSVASSLLKPGTLARSDRGRGVEPQRHALGAKSDRGLGQIAGGDAVVHQQGLDGVAGRRVLRLAVDREGHRLVDVGRPVDVEVADAVGMAQHRDAGVLLHEADERVRAAGDDQVDVAVERQQLHGLLAGGEQQHGFGLDRGAGQAPVDGVDDRPARPERLPAALEDHAVARLEGERGYLDDRVGAGFEDHRDDSQGTTDPGQAPSPSSSSRWMSTLPTGSGSAFTLRTPAISAFSLRGVELEARKERRRDAVGLGSLAIGLVGRHDLGL